MTEMKNTLERMSRRLRDIEQCISSPEDRIMEIAQAEEQKGKLKKKKNENSIRDLWDIINCTNICVLGFPRRRERKKAYKMYLIKSWLKTSQT